MRVLRAASRLGLAGLRWAASPRGAVTLLALAVAVVFPLAFINQQVATIAFLTLIFVTAAVAWNIFSGYSGYLSLGHAAFFGSGAYVAGIAAKDWQLTGGAEFALLPLAAAAAALIAVPFGLIALRVRRHTFVVITIAIFFIFQLMAFNLTTLTNGTIGMNAPFLLWDPVSFDQRFYYVALLVALCTIVLSWLIRGSRFGLQLRAIRDDEDRAASLGVRAMPVKLTAFVISGAITGLAGALWFLFVGQVLPQSGFDPLFDLSVALMAFLGGLGTVIGPLLGALIIEPTQQYLTTAFSNSYLSQILLGALFLAVVLFLPRGLIPTLAEKGRNLLARRKDRVPPSGPAAPAAGCTGSGQGSSPMTTALLRAAGISKAFGGVQALQDCTVEVQAGSISGLIGPNGSGKTTLFNVITGYERPDAGEVFFADQQITGSAPHRVFAAGIGRTFQLTRIFPRLTVLENMIVAAQHTGGRGFRNPLARAGGHADRQRAMELLEFTGIAGHAARLAGTLSYGQRKLLELSYVLVADPAIVLLDEPAGGINPSLVNQLADRIRELNASGKTFLIVEHNMEFVMGLCQHIAVLDYGTVVAAGPPARVRDDPRVLDAYLGAAEDDE